MAHIAMFIGSMGHADGLLHVSGQAFLSDGGDPVNWAVDVAFNATAVTINNAIRDAAIAAAELESHTVGMLDKKTIYAGAIGL